MDAFFIPLFAVAMAEIGDKTQLIALCLASRYRKPVPIILGIFAATLASHIVAGLIGQWLGASMHGAVLHTLLGLSFLAAAIWALIPDKVDCESVEPTRRKSIFTTTFATFFIAEIGDKTQLATATLAAQFHPLPLVIVGTTLGMMAANIPAVLLSNAITRKLPVKLIRILSGIVFAALGLYEFSRLL